MVSCKPSTASVESDEAANNLALVLQDLSDSSSKRSSEGSNFSLEADSLLEVAREDFFADSTDLANIIWFGRRLAQQFQFRSAAKIYSYGLTIHPDSPELYRHRGELLVITGKSKLALQDLDHGIRLAASRDIEGEPDVIPNKLDIPLSNLHFNLFFYQGFAFYLESNYKQAYEAWTRSRAFATNSDLIILATYWQCLAQLQNADTESIVALVATVDPNMEIIQYPYYLEQCLYFKLLHDRPIPFPNSSRYYGLVLWESKHNNDMLAKGIIDMIEKENERTSLGYLAMKADQNKH